MTWAKNVRHWTMRSIHSAILGAALLGTNSLAHAQTPGAAAAKLPKLHFTRSQSFDLPIVMDQDYRVTLSEIRLYVRTPASGWKLQESVAPHSTRFNCKTTQDGEYWYTLATVDRAGKQTPADVNLEPPSQRVVIDTAPPVIQVQPATSAEGDVCLRVTLADAYPDHASLKAHFKTDFGKLPLDAVANQAGVFRVKGTDQLRFPIEVMASDMAGNVATKVVDMRDLLGTGANQTQAVSTAQAPAPIVQPVPPKTEITQTVAKPPLPDAPLPPPRFDVPPQLPTPPSIRNDAPGTRITPPPLASQVLVKEPGPIESPLLKVPIVPEASKPGGAATQLINTTHASVEYRIDHVGPSGVGKVEIFMTPDNGISWHSLGEDADKKSPAEINLPGDGVYGIRIMVSNGNGFGGKRPVRGDAPHCAIEVDTTAPFVLLRSEKVQASTGAGHVELRWNATDSNLGAEPVSLFYRTKADGPWQAIARNLKNDGLYNWNFQRDAGGQFYFKIEVADRAGNVSHDVSRQPVVIDVSEPQATVVGVSGNGAATPRP